jgi:hypothetical protein
LASSCACSSDTAEGYLSAKVPVEVVWLAAIFYFICGGQHFFFSMYFIMAVDMVEDSERWVPTKSTRDTSLTRARSNVLCLIYGLGHLSSLLWPPMGAVLMRRNLWAPFWVSVALIFFRYIVILAIPETRKSAPRPSMEHPNGTATTKTGRIIYMNQETELQLTAIRRRSRIRFYPFKTTQACYNSTILVRILLLLP